MEIDLLIPFYGTLGLSVVMSFLVILMAMKTPALTWLMASIRGKTLLAVFRKDKTLHFIPTYYQSGIAETERYGSFMVTPNSTYRERKSGVGVMATNSDIGVSFDIKYYQFANELKKQDINNIYEADEANDQIKESETALICGKCAQKQGLKTELLNKTFTFDDFKDFMYHNLHPSAIFSAIEAKVAIERAKDRIGNYKWIPYIAVLLVCAGIAVMIIYMAMQNATPQVHIDYNTLSDAMKNAPPPAGG